MTRIPLYLALLLLAGSAGATSVWKYDAAKQVVILKDVNVGAIAVNNDVCLFAGTTSLGCGKVMAVAKGANAAKIAMQSVNQAPTAGQEVALRTKNRNVSSTAEVSDTFKESKNTRSIGFALGMTAGTNYFYPSGHIQFVVARQWTIGLMPMYAGYSSTANGTASSLSAFGGYLTGSYYYTHSALRGLEIEGGIGLYSVTGTVTGQATQTQTPLAGKFTVGWRGRALDLGLDLGIAAGVQYIGSTPTAVIATSFTGILPMLNAYVGFGI